MDWGKAACCILSNLNFIAFSWAIYRYFRFSKSNPSREMQILKYLALATTVVQNWFMITNPTNLWEQIPALILYLLSGGLFWWSIHSAREVGLAIAFSRKLSPRLLTNGPYRWVRHPFYLSYILHWVAGVFAAAETWLCAAVAILSYFYLAAALQEESDILSSPLANDYKSYRLRAGMFLPRLANKSQNLPDEHTNSSRKNAS